MKNIFNLSIIKISIFQKLLIGILAMLILNTIITFVGIVSINKLENNANQMLSESIERSYFEGLKTMLQELVMPANDYLIHGNNIEAQHLESILLKTYTKIYECRQHINDTLSHNVLDKYEETLDQVEYIAFEILDLEYPIGNVEGAIMMEEMDALTNKAIQEIDELLIFEGLKMAIYTNANQSTNNRATRIIILTGLFIAFCLVIGGYFYVREITTPIKDLAQVAEKISLGDLSVKADIKTRTRDEIKEFAASFNNMIGILEKTTLSRDYFNNILNRMVDTLIITDAKGIIKIINQATLDLLGYSEDELLYQSIEKILFLEKSEKSFEVLTGSSIFDESVTNVYNIYYSKFGEAIPVCFSQSLIYDNKNNLSGIICIAYHKSKSNSALQNLQQIHDEEEAAGKIKAVGEVPLTDRELEIAKLITKENSNKQIAKKLFISVRTVETHRKNIMQKLNTKSVISLVHYVTQNDLI